MIAGRDVKPVNSPETALLPYAPAGGSRAPSRTRGPGSSAPQVVSASEGAFVVAFEGLGERGGVAEIPPARTFRGRVNRLFRLDRRQHSPCKSSHGLAMARRVGRPSHESARQKGPSPSHRRRCAASVSTFHRGESRADGPLEGPPDVRSLSYIE